MPKHSSACRLLLKCGAVLVCALLLAGLARPYHNPAYIDIFTLSEGNLPQVLLYEETEYGVLLCFNDNGKGTVLLLNEADGRVQVQREYGQPFYFASRQGGRVILVMDGSWDAEAHQLSLSDLNERQVLNLGFPSESLSLLDGDENGNLYLSPVGNENMLLGFSADNEFLGEWSFPDNLIFLQIRADTLFAYTDVGQWISAPLSDLSALTCAALPVRPGRILTEQYLLDADGMVRDYTDPDFPALYACPVPPSSYSFHTMDGQNRLIWADNAEMIQRADPAEDGESYRIEGSVQAVSAQSAIVQQDSRLCYVRLDSFEPVPPEEENSPSEPESEPEPEPDPKPGGETGENARPEWLTQNGEYLYAPAGKTIKNLRDAFAPLPITVARETGELLPGGTLRTGFQISGGDGQSFTLIIPGDCNGSGTVNSADIKEAQKMLLGVSSCSWPCFMAADLDGDGEITTADLVLLSARIP